jgi:predicted phosphodiesterase
MKEDTMKFKVKYLFILIPLLAFGCISPEDIGNLTASTDVDERFEESIDGETKKLDLPESPEVSEAHYDHFVFLWVTDMHIQARKSTYFKELGIYAEEVGANFILHSGDLADHGDEEEYEHVNTEVREYLSLYNVYFISAIGNHDLSGDGWDAYKEIIGPSVFTFDYGNTFFIFIDTGNATVGRDQMEWIEEQLDESNKPNKILLSHFPFYDGTLETPTIMGDPDERYKLMYFIEEYGVDYVLTGHKHSIEKYKIGDAVYLCGGTASHTVDPINGDDLLYRFEINGDDIDYEKVDLDDID